MKKHLFSLGLTLLSAATAFALPSLLQTKDFKASSISNLDFNMSWENLEVKEQTSGSNITIEIYCNKKKYIPEVKQSGSTLLIDSIPMERFFFPMESKQCTVMVYLPAGKKFDRTSIRLSSGELTVKDNLYSEGIVLQTSSGSLKTENLTGSDVELIASSGSIKAKEISASKASVQASSGSISISAVQAQSFTAKTSSGSIKTDSLRANDADLSASSGSLRLKDVTVQKIELSTSSGGITVDGLLSNRFSVTSSSGTIGLELNGAPTKNSSINATSGTVFVSLPNDASATVSASTTSGGFVNTFIGEKIESHANCTQKINGGGATISISTTSGSITVDKGISRSKSSERYEDDVPVVNIDRPIF